MQIVTKEKYNKAKQCLLDNGIDQDEIDIILQALCYILCDEETEQFAAETIKTFYCPSH